MASSLLNFIKNSNLFSFLPLLLFLILLYKWLLSTKSNTKLHLPPSPPKLPLIGHLHKLGKLPHRSLGSLSHKYGDLMLLYFGQKPTLVVSSSKYAQEFLKTHDLNFSNRSPMKFINKILYDGNDIAFNSYCPKWRHMKSICVLQLLSTKKVMSLRSIREEEVALLIEKIKSYNGSIINLKETFMTLSSELTSRAALGRKYTMVNASSANFHRLFRDLIEVLGAVSVGDYIPMFGWIDKLNGMEGRVECLRKQFDDFMEEVVQAHEAQLNNVHEKDDEEYVKDFVDVLLEVHRENPEQLSRDDIKAVILDMFVAGTESSATTVEWAMIELLRHPASMGKLKDEVRYIVKTGTRVNEDDFENMVYLDAVIKETLRLHPPAMLLPFRESNEDVKIDNYDVVARTQVIINLWTIHHDPKFWHDPEKFLPERFLHKKFSLVDYKGHNFNFIPFGAGRRGCPGISYGIINIKLILASLIHEFDWILPNGRDGTSLDAEESAGLSISPLKPLKVIASQNVV